SVSATGTGISYQWQKNGANINGATSNTFSIPNAATSDAATYTVIVSGIAPCDPVTSQNAELIVNQDIEITTQPDPQTICEGGNITFTVATTGNISDYVWRKGGIPVSDGGGISGSSTASLTISGATISHAGSYD